MHVFALISLVVGWQTSEIEARVKRHGNAANYRALASAYVDDGRYQDASRAFEQAAVLYRKLGDSNAGKRLEEFANRYRTTIKIYVNRPVTHPEGEPVRAKFEPAVGCYLGANIEREDETRNPQSFNFLIQKHHAIFFMYRAYGVGFPKDYARELKKARCALQLAFEPKDLNQVNADGYLQRFAQDAADSGIPIFLRFASEMNGAWTPYHSDPALYVQKFRLVSQLMKEIAPNVAMVWCPNEIPEAPIPAYFPGDEYVDWVGVNFYSVIYNDADRSRGAEWRHPEDALAYLYGKYGARHPLMVGEWAASHLSTVDMRERPDFARLKIAQFYAAIPRIYPHVKAVSWLSFNALKYASRDRQLNDYSLFNNRTVAAGYTEAVSNPYYLDQVSADASAPTVPVLVGTVDPLRSGDMISAYVRSYDGKLRVTYLLDGARIAEFNDAGAYEFAFPRAVKPGKHLLSVQVRDSAGRLAATSKQSVTTE